MWGLTYTPGTDTLRRSSAVELCRRLHQEGATVSAHDPAVITLPADLAPMITLAPGPLEALSGASALVVATAWPEFRSIDAGDVAGAMTTARVLDPARFLASTLGSDRRIRYVTVGQGRA